MSRLDQLAAQHGLDAVAVAALSALLELLAADERAPTTVRQPAEAVDVHVADALSALALPELVRGARVADLGAGAGIPGLVLAAARPDLRLVEVESNARKCAFVERAIAAMGLANAEVARSRAEEWREGLGACDVVLARALAPLNVLVEYAAPLLRPGGALVSWKGSPDDTEVTDGLAAAAVLGLDAGRVEPVAPFPGARSRYLYVYLKVGSTPNRYPRRAGMARKRPLGA